jgi:hypothetical protein
LNIAATVVDMPFDGCKQFIALTADKIVLNFTVKGSSGSIVIKALGFSGL